MVLIVCHETGQQRRISTSALCVLDHSNKIVQGTTLSMVRTFIHMRADPAAASRLARSRFTRASRRRKTFCEEDYIDNFILSTSNPEGQIWGRSYHCPYCIGHAGDSKNTTATLFFQRRRKRRGKACRMMRIHTRKDSHRLDKCGSREVLRVEVSATSHLCDIIVTLKVQKKVPLKFGRPGEL